MGNKQADGWGEHARICAERIRQHAQSVFTPEGMTRHGGSVPLQWQGVRPRQRTQCGEYYQKTIQTYPSTQRAHRPRKLYVVPRGRRCVRVA